MKFDFRIHIHICSAFFNLFLKIVSLLKNIHNDNHYRISY